MKAKIIAERKMAKHYSVSKDSTPDTAHVDQLSIVMRYVRIDDEQPVEHFLAFIDIEKHEGKYLFETLKSFLDECGIKLEDCRGQTYDNASNMSGTYSGVQARFHQVNWYRAQRIAYVYLGPQRPNPGLMRSGFSASFSDFTHSCQPRHRGGRNC